MSIPESVPTEALLFALLSQGHDHGQMVYDEEQENTILAQDAAGEHKELACLVREEIGEDYAALGAVLHEAMWQAWRCGFEQGYACQLKHMPAQGWQWFFRTTAREEDTPAGATTRRERHRAHFLGRGFPAEGGHDAH